MKSKSNFALIALVIVSTLIVTLVLWMVVAGLKP